MKEHVLVIAHIEDGNFLAIEKARNITLPMDPTLDIIQFIKPSEGTQTASEEDIKQLKEALNENIERIFEGSTQVNSDVIVSDNISDWVANYCDKTAVDLVIKGGHRSESLLHTPCDWKLMRQIHCPIFIVTNTKWKSRANILLALDLSRDDSLHQQLNASILNWGIKLSEITHNPMHAVYSIPIAKPLLEFDLVNKEAVVKKKGAAAEQKMQALLKKYDVESVTSHIIAGPPDKTLPHEANELKSDLVVIGFVDHDGFGKLFAGNTAEKVIHHLRTDCLVVKLPVD